MYNQDVDLHSFFADPDLAVFINADLDTAFQNCCLTLNFVQQIPYKDFAVIGPHQ